MSINLVKSVVIHRSKKRDLRSKKRDKASKSGTYGNPSRVPPVDTYINNLSYLCSENLHVLGQLYECLVKHNTIKPIMSHSSVDVKSKRVQHVFIFY